MKTITMTQFKARPGECIYEIEHGQSFLISKHGKIVAKLTPVDEKKLPTVTELEGLLHRIDFTVKNIQGTVAHKGK